MKNLFNTLLVLVSMMAINSCTKLPGDTILNNVGAKDQIEAKEYTYNTATKGLSPDADINATVSSQKDVSMIYTYIVREGMSDSLLDILYTKDLENKRQISYTVNGTKFSKIRMENVTSLKLVIKRADNSSDEAFISLTSFTPPLPKWEHVPASLVPDDEDEVQVTATALSDNGITKIQLFDDYQGVFTKIYELDLNKETSYEFTYTYTYRPNTANLKLVMYDTYGLEADAIISIPVLPYEVYKDVVMNTQGTSTVTFNNSAIILPSFELIGPCSFADNEEKISFFAYNTSSGVNFYSPSNTSNVIRNYYCNGTKYEPITTPSGWTATRFRVLLPADPIQNAVYEAYNSNSLMSLSDDVFANIASPSSSTMKYSSTADPSANTFNTTTAYLAWVRIPDPEGAINALIRFKEIIEDGNTSTIKFDLLVPKK